MFRIPAKWISVLLIVTMVASLCMAVAAEETKWPKVRLAFSDIPAMDSIAFDAVCERLREMGVPLEVYYFKTDELTNQAVVSGQCDIGSGTPYGIIQRMNEQGIPIRFFFQWVKLSYIPVVRKSKYQSWEDLDGHEIAVHARASGTEAQVKMVEELYGIKFSRITYVPGTEVRGVAMLNGTMDASFLGLFTANWLMKEAPDEFMILPFEGVAATDDALYARLDWLKENEEVVRLIMKEALKIFRRVTADPSYVLELRRQYNLLPDLPPEIEAEIPVYWPIVAQRGLRAINGGSEEAAKVDLHFYSIAGQLEGPLEDLKVDDFWYLQPLNDVLEEIGRISVDYE